MAGAAGSRLCVGEWVSFPSNPGQTQGAPAPLAHQAEQLILCSNSSCGNESRDKLSSPSSQSFKRRCGGGECCFIKGIPSHLVSPFSGSTGAPTRLNSLVSGLRVHGGFWGQETLSQKVLLRTSLVDQWLRLRTPKAGDPGFTPGQGTGSHMPQNQRSQMPQLKVSMPRPKSHMLQPRPATAKIN